MLTAAAAADCFRALALDERNLTGSLAHPIQPGRIGGKRVNIKPSEADKKGIPPLFTESGQSPEVTLALPGRQDRGPKRLADHAQKIKIALI